MDNKQIHLVEIGQRIKKARKAKGWSQETLAEHVNIHATYMSQIETGKVNLTINVLKSIADCLNISMKDLVSDNAEIDELQIIGSELRVGYFATSDDEKHSLLKAVRGIIREFKCNK